MKKAGRPSLPVGMQKRKETVRFDPRTWADIERFSSEKGITNAETIRQLVKESLGGIWKI